MFLRKGGRCELLTSAMEMELCRWVYRCTNRGAAPSGESIREMALILCKTDHSHWINVLIDHPTLELHREKMFSRNWLRTFLDKGKKMSPPINIGRRSGQKTEEGRLQINREMLDSFYNLLATICKREEVNFLPRQIWNFDESASRLELIRDFVYGITGASWAHEERVGSAKTCHSWHVYKHGG